MSQTQVESNQRSTYGTPRWVKAFGIIILVLLVVIGIALLSGGEHSPSRHMPPSGVTEDHTPPAGLGVQHP